MTIVYDKKNKRLTIYSKDRAPITYHNVSKDEAEKIAKRNFGKSIDKTVGDEDNKTKKSVSKTRQKDRDRDRHKSSSSSSSVSKIPMEKVRYDTKRKELTIGNTKIRNVEGITYKDGKLERITIRKDGKLITFDPYKNKVYSIQDDKTYVNLKYGEAWDKETGKKLSILKEKDLKRLRDLGVQVNISKEAKALSNWYWKQKEKEAQQYGAKNFAQTIAQQINAQYGSEVAEVIKKNGKYYVRIKPEIAQRSKLDEVLLPNVAKTYGRLFKYANYKVRDNLIEIEQKQITEPAYLMSKYFSADPVKRISVDFKGNQGNIIVETAKGKTTLERLAKTNPEKYKAFMRIYGNEISKLQQQVEQDIGKKLQMSIAVRYENGKLILPSTGAQVKQKPKAPTSKIQTLTPTFLQDQKQIQIRAQTKPQQPQFKSKAEYYKQLAEKNKKYGGFWGDEQIKWFYTWGATSEKVVNELAKLGHNINKGISAFEDWIGVDFPIIGTAHDPEKVKAIDRKLAEIDKELEYKALYEARKNWGTYLDPRKPITERLSTLFLGTPMGNILTLGAGELAVGGKVAEMGSKAPTVARALEVASANAKTFVAGGTLFTAMEESQKTLSIPTYRPLQDKEAVKREFLAGGTSALVMSNLQLGLSEGLRVIPAGTTATNIAKRLAVAGASGYAGGYTYEGTKELMEKGKVDFEKAHQTGLVFAGFGLGLEGLSVGVDAGVLPTVEGAKVQFKDLTTGKTHTYYGLAIRKGTSAQPIVGLYDFKPAIGTPKIDVSKGVYSFEPPLSPAEAKILDKPFRDYAKRLTEGKFSPAEQKILQKEYEAWAKKYAGELPEGIKQIDWQKYYAGGLEMTRQIWKAQASPQIALKDVISKSDLFNKQATEKILKILQKEKAGVVVYGSMPQKMYLGEYMPRTPHDIDLMTYGKPPEVLAKKLVKELKPIYGKNIRVSPERPSLVEIYHGGKWRHAFDIHNAYGGEYALEGATELSNYWVGYGLRTKEPFITQEGYAIISFGEQGARKGVSSLTPRAFGFMPEAHRLKDLGDFIRIGEFAKTELGLKEIEQPLGVFKASIPEDVLKSISPSGLVAVPYTPSYVYSYKALTPFAYVLRPEKADYKVKAYKFEPFKVYTFKPIEYTYKPTYTPKKPSYAYKFEYAYKTPPYEYKPSYEYSYKPEYIYTHKPYKEKPYKPTYDYTYAPKYDYKIPYEYKYKATYRYEYKPKYQYRYIYNIPYKYKYLTGYKLDIPILRPPEKIPFKLPKPTFAFERVRPKLALRPKKEKKKGFRELLADLLSIQIAQNIWGRATQPKLTRKVWAYETKSAIGFVPTAEMFRTGKPERFRKPRLGLKPLKLKSLINLINMGR